MKLALLLLALLLAPSALLAQKMTGKETHNAGNKSASPKKGHMRGTVGNNRSPKMSLTTTGDKKDVTGSNDAHLQNVSDFAADHLSTNNSSLDFVQYKAEVQVVAGLMYTLHYKGNNKNGVCQLEHTIVVYDKPWTKERTLKSDTKAACT